MDKKFEIEKNTYKLVKEYKNGFSLEKVKEKWTDYFDEYDYIVGDYAYDKLRLKGFCKKENKKYKSLNDYTKIDLYVKEDCAYECSYFILEKIKPSK